MSQVWGKLPERGTTTALALITWIGLRLGRGAARLLLYPISAYFLITATAPRQGSRIYLHKVLNRRPTWLDLFRHFHCFAATILDRVYLLVGQSRRFDLQVHSGQWLLDQVNAGRGCILLGSHLGSFEVLRVLGVTLHRLPIKVMMNVNHNRRITRFFRNLNPGIADTVIPIRGLETLLNVKESLDQGYLVGTLGDRVVDNDKITRCRFLGEEANFPADQIIWASLMKCPVILFFGLYRGGNRYDVYFELFAERITLDRHRREDDIRRWAQRYADRLEHYARMAPYNWFNFYDFWSV